MSQMWTGSFCQKYKLSDSHGNWFHAHDTARRIRRAFVSHEDLAVCRVTIYKLKCINRQKNCKYNFDLNFETLFDKYMNIIIDISFVQVCV